MPSISSRLSKELFAHVEKMIIGTLIVSAGAHVSSADPAIVLFGYLRHGLVGRGVELFGVILLVLNFLDGLYKLAKAGLACGVSGRDVALLHRAVGPVDPADPRLSRRIAGGRSKIPPAEFARHLLLRRELGQHVLAGGRKRSGLRGQALHDAAAAGRNAAAKRANIAAAGRPQHEQVPRAAASAAAPAPVQPPLPGRLPGWRSPQRRLPGVRASPLAALTAC